MVIVWRQSRPGLANQDVRHLGLRLRWDAFPGHGMMSDRSGVRNMAKPAPRPRQRTDRAKSQHPQAARRVPNPADATWNAVTLRRRLKEDPAFQVMTAEGTAWIDPFSGTEVPAAFDTQKVALEWLLEHRPWTRRSAPMNQVDVMIRRWELFLRERIREERRLRMFRSDGAWLNPFTGTFVKGIRTGPQGMDSTTLHDLARALAACPQAANGSWRDLGLLEQNLREANVGLSTRLKAAPAQAGPSQTPAAPAATASKAPLAPVVAPTGPVPVETFSKKKPSQPPGTAPAAGPADDDNPFAHLTVISCLAQDERVVVHQARCNQDGRKAILRIHHQVLDPGAATQRILELGRRLQMLRHPCLADHWQTGVHRGRFFVVREYLAGPDLETLISQRGSPLDEITTLRLMRGVANGAQMLLTNGLPHRHLVPSNLIFDEAGHLKITDPDLLALMATDQRPQGPDPQEAVLALGQCLFLLLAGSPYPPGPEGAAAFDQVASRIHPATASVLARLFGRDAKPPPASPGDLSRLLLACAQLSDDSETDDATLSRL